ncbi:hypothetical protein SAMN05444682_104188 [Parapedobacter indicus]|uniref:Uncharacterized protein n=1 Tax=Parapedobacter indicus TaxID=1477437 RepID=A0A1I3IR28_9SPHI|nr:hypothetical protein CLV26_104188 [Parapedobacter indicus]SFI50445.1 hypothetical protein SAMN05444682_104188 [Parapedobacter indicus]
MTFTRTQGETETFLKSVKIFDFSHCMSSTVSNTFVPLYQPAAPRTTNMRNMSNLLSKPCLTSD